MNKPSTQMKQILKNLKLAASKDDLANLSIAQDFEEDEEAYRSPSADADTPRVWIDPTEMESNHKNVLVLLDWDDTLFPTSMIVDILKNRDENGFALVSDEDIELLTKLGNLTMDLLSHLVEKYGSDNVHIVTNSLQGWIKDSLAFAACIAKVYKDIETLLYTSNITMDSAQSLHGKKENSTPIMWKRLCFENIFHSKSDSVYHHILSIGDQWTDHHSVKQSLHSVHYAPVHHMIKLKMTPDLSDMINEILYIQTCFAQIFDGIANESSPYYFHNNPTPVIVDYHSEELKFLNFAK